MTTTTNLWFVVTIALAMLMRDSMAFVTRPGSSHVHTLPLREEYHQRRHHDNVGVLLWAAATPSSSTEETEAERLLRKARELREQASKQEQEIHQQQTQKKSQQQQHYDTLIDFYLSNNNDNNNNKDNNNNDIIVQGVVDRFHKKPVSMDTLEHMVDRLDDRHAIASGKEHVTVDFQRTKLQRNQAEMNKIDAQLELLLQAVQVLDDEFRQKHAQKKTGGVAGDSTGSLLYSVSSAEANHWGGGQAAKYLKQRLQEKRREREEQFLKRQEEFYEAQRVKKNQPPPPKVGDDHGFLK
ncbi:hypothetical protein IV203_014100 [Nitzschia inconspicua]|uniref:Uncharacterized protein n=1 Tax=Nitzschia inconspicua TaxID=303405 RepID=A0A9K3K572_9STRA|nr:hypothetical protein IV203_014288 [Nitzschia inconspicua]KAG7375005.1 hypothetical protein IV203_014100 [Nitzschia inconspicua]